MIIESNIFLFTNFCHMIIESNTFQFTNFCQASSKPMNNNLIIMKIISEISIFELQIDIRYSEQSISVFWSYIPMNKNSFKLRLVVVTDNKRAALM